MSWSVNVVGTPEKICEHLDEQSAAYNGQSKEEFDSALPHLKALLRMNVGGIS